MIFELLNIAIRRQYKRISLLKSFHCSKDIVCYSHSKIECTHLDDKTIKHLERLSLVNFENQKYISIVEEAIQFADTINSVNTDSVEPLITVLENQSLRLRNDVVTEGNCREELLKNAAVTEEGYFVAPPGNIPLNQASKKS